MKMVLGENMYNFLFNIYDFFIILIIPISLLFEGVRRKLIARMQNRIGPSVLQPFYDAIKLFQKTEPNTNKKNIISAVTFLYLLTNFSLFLFLPFSVLSFYFDVVLFVCIFILSIILYIISGLISNPFYRRFGFNRDLDIMLFSGIIFTIVFFTFITFTTQSTFYSENSNTLFRLPIASFCLFVIALLETKKTPFVITEERTEIITDATRTLNGRSLAFMEISKSLRMTFFVFLITSFFFGSYNLLTFSITSLLIFFVFIFIQVVTSCYRFDQIRNFLIIVLSLSVVELIGIIL